MIFGILNRDPSLARAKKHALLCALALSSISLAEEPTKKVPIPDPAALKESGALVDEAYKAELAAARTPEERTAVVDKLLRAAQEEKGAAARFALLSKALAIATNNGDFGAVATAINNTDDVFQIDALKMRADAAISMSKTARKAEQRELTDTTFELVDMAIAADRYDVARSMVEIALNSARLTGDTDLQRVAAAKAEALREVQSSYSAINAAIATLTAAPADPDANLKVGKFRCFIKGEWERGLPMLAIGSDAALRAQAEADIAGARKTEAAALDAVGDGWWAIAGTEIGLAKVQLQRRATTWYRQSAPALNGLAKAKVEARIASVANLEPPRVVNLLKFVDPAKDAVAGNWELHNGTLKSDTTQFARVEFLYRPPAEYDYKVVFQRLAGRHEGNADVGSICWAMGHQFLFTIDDGYESIGFVEIVGHEWPDHNPTIRRSKSGWAKPGREYTSVVKVRKGIVRAYLAGKLATEWKTDYSDMRLNEAKGRRLRRDDTIGLLTYDATAFSSVEIIEVTGEGHKLQREER